MKEKFNALIKNNTSNLVPHPPNANVIRSLWIFRVKTKSDGSFEHYKARLVGDGKSQREGLDYDETYSPVVFVILLILIMFVFFESLFKVLSRLLELGINDLLIL